MDADLLFGLALFQALFLNSGKGRHQVFAMMSLEIWDQPNIFNQNVQTNFQSTSTRLPSLKLTANGPFAPKGNESYSNHPFSGVNSLLVSGRVHQLAVMLKKKTDNWFPKKCPTCFQNQHLPDSMHINFRNAQRKNRILKWTTCLRRPLSSEVNGDWPWSFCRKRRNPMVSWQPVRSFFKGNLWLAMEKWRFSSGSPY